jgi:L-threonylcarbamoyladenylate synthase
MNTIYRPADEAGIAAAADVIQASGVAVFPTDTVYGVGSLAWDEQAVAKLYEAKGRDFSKAIPVLVNSVGAVDQVANLGLLPLPMRRIAALLMNKFWPGGLTIVLPRDGGLPDRLTAGGATIALRMPNHPVTLALLAQTGGALAVTSANRSGNPSPATAEQARADLDGLVDIILDGGAAPGGVESTIIILDGDVPRITREGAITREQIKAAGIDLG